MKLSTVVIIIIVLLVISIQPVQAGEWIKGKSNSNMKVENTLSCNGMSVKLTDYSTNDNGYYTYAMFEVTTEGKTTTEIIKRGETCVIDDRYKILFWDAKVNFIHIILYYIPRPVFSVTTTTKEKSNLGYDYTTTIKFTCTGADANNIEIEYFGKNIDGTFKDLKISSLETKESKTVTIRHDLQADSKLTLSVSYKDIDNKKYTQNFDILNCTEIMEEKESKSETNTVTATKTRPNDYYSRKAFIRAIDIAIKKIEFTDQQLKTINELRKEILDGIE